MSYTATAPANRTRSIAFCGLSIALMAVSAWITVPFGPVPFTLQTFVVVFVVLALKPKEALASVGIYILLGAVGLPVFSGMRGGIGMLANTSGGFIWGFLAGAVVAIALSKVLRRWSQGSKSTAVIADFVIAFAFMAVCYLCGWLQLMGVANMGPAQAFAAGVAPFIVIDVIKTVFAVIVAKAVRQAV